MSFEAYVERLLTISGLAQTRSSATCFSISPITTAILVPILLPEESSYQISIPGNTSQILTATTSTSNYEYIFDNAIEAYQKKTKKDLRSHSLLEKLHWQNCDSPDAVLKVLYEQIPGFNEFRGPNDKLTKWLNLTVNVLCTFSGVVGGGVGQASPKELRFIAV